MSCLSSGDDGLEDGEKTIGIDENKFRDDEKIMGNDRDGGTMGDVKKFISSNEWMLGHDNGIR
jgi:hypothetical protein